MNQKSLQLLIINSLEGFILTDDALDWTLDWHPLLSSMLQLVSDCRPIHSGFRICSSPHRWRRFYACLDNFEPRSEIRRQPAYALTLLTTHMRRGTSKRDSFKWPPSEACPSPWPILRLQLFSHASSVLTRHGLSKHP